MSSSQQFQVADLSAVPIGHVRHTTAAYVDSAQSGGEAEREYLGSNLRLENDTLPHCGIKTEQPFHRVVLYLKAQGKTNAEIASATGYTAIWIGQICKQPWFRKRLVELADELGRDAVENVLRGEMLPSVMTLVEVRDNIDEKGATRVAASNSLLDRFYGKPVQRVESEVTHVPLDKVTEENAKLDREIASLNEQLKSHSAN